MNFYLGTANTAWFERTDVPLFVSQRTLAGRRRLPHASGPWALDSGGFTELSLHGGYVTSTAQYAAAAARYRDEVGRLDWCAPQDFMCEPFMVDKTGLSVREHQARTVGNYLDLASLLGSLVTPVVQGWELADYHRCVDLYDAAGVDLTLVPIVGVGSVCRRQDSHQIAAIMESLSIRGLRLHGFGVSTRGLSRFAGALTSSDSMAWSQLARRATGALVRGCTHRKCSNCLPWALEWRRRLLSAMEHPQLELALA